MAEQLHQIDANHKGIILEPEGRNTAPAIALAAIKALGDESREKTRAKNEKLAAANSQPVLLVLPADHLVADVTAFRKALFQALPLAQAGKLVTFGIVPTRPETGYGYIRGEREPKLTDEELTALPIAEFVERPDIDAATKYCSSGEYFWNSGIFMFQPSSYLRELKSHRPEIYTACEEAMLQAKVDADFIRVDKAAFLKCPSVSIDYAV